ncbi:hypothetical protein Anas_11935, partial [Armadillidium nasatum]
GPSQEERIWGSNRPPIKLSYKVSDPEELSSDLNGNAGHKPISRKMKLDDGVDTEDSFAVATSSAAMPKLEEDSNTYFIPPQTDGIQQKRT